MKLTIIAHPNSKNPRIETDLLGDTHVYVSEPSLDGRANKAIIKSLAKHFKVKKNQIILLSGEKNKLKNFKILT